TMLNWSVAHTVEELMPRLDAEQVQASLEPLLSMLKKAEDETADAIVAVIGHLGARLAPAQAGQALEAILDAFPKFASSELSGMKYLGGLARQVPAQATSKVLARIVELANEFEHGDALFALARLIPHLPSSPSPEQVDSLLHRLVDG